MVHFPSEKQAGKIANSFVTLVQSLFLSLVPMISATARYALRAVVWLAKQADQSLFVNRSEIATATRIPVDYLLKVLNELDRAGIVESRRGPGGGYRLKTAPQQTTVLQVVLAVDTIPRFSECPLGFTEHNNLCPLHRLLDNVNAKVEETFRAFSIADLIPERKQSQTCDFPFLQEN